MSAICLLIWDSWFANCNWDIWPRESWTASGYAEWYPAWDFNEGLKTPVVSFWWLKSNLTPTVPIQPYHTSGWIIPPDYPLWKCGHFSLMTHIISRLRASAIYRQTNAQWPLNHPAPIYLSYWMKHEAIQITPQMKPEMTCFQSLVCMLPLYAVSLPASLPRARLFHAGIKAQLHRLSIMTTVTINIGSNLLCPCLCYVLLERVTRTPWQQSPIMYHSPLFKEHLQGCLPRITSWRSAHFSLSLRPERCHGKSCSCPALLSQYCLRVYMSLYL